MKKHKQRRGPALKAKDRLNVKRLAKELAAIIQQGAQELAASMTAQAPKAKAAKAKTTKKRGAAKKRGRPSKAVIARRAAAQLRWARARKAKGTATAEDLQLLQSQEQPDAPKRPRGRPRKARVDADDASPETTTTSYEAVEMTSGSNFSDPAYEPTTYVQPIATFPADSTSTSVP